MFTIFTLQIRKSERVGSRRGERLGGIRDLRNRGHEVCHGPRPVQQVNLGLIGGEGRAFKCMSSGVLLFRALRTVAIGGSADLLQVKLKANAKTRELDAVGTAGGEVNRIYG